MTHKRLAHLIIFGLLSCSVGASSSALALERVKLALPAKSMGYFPRFVAAHRGCFKHKNIEFHAGTTGARP